MIFFLLWSFWLATPYLIFGDVSYAKIHDNADSNLSMYLAVAGQRSQAEIGYWNPQVAVADVEEVVLGPTEIAPHRAGEGILRGQLQGNDQRQAENVRCSDCDRRSISLSS